jgi:hypothetical protein
MIRQGTIRDERHNSAGYGVCLVIRTLRLQPEGQHDEAHPRRRMTRLCMRTSVRGEERQFKNDHDVGPSQPDGVHTMAAMVVFT